MPLPPQKFREIVFQILYSRCTEPEMIPFMMEEIKTTRRTVAECCEKAQKVLEKQAEIEEKIGGISTEYTLERISSVERTILLLGYFELFYDANLPLPVVLAEAIRLCRKFGTPEGANFVNAILHESWEKSSQPALSST